MSIFSCKKKPKRKSVRRKSQMAMIFWGVWTQFLGIGCLNSSTTDALLSAEPEKISESESNFLRGYHQALPTQLSARQARSVVRMIKDAQAERWLKKRAWASLPAIDWSRFSSAERDLFEQEIQTVFVQGCAVKSPVKRVCRRARLWVEYKKGASSLAAAAHYCALLERELGLALGLKEDLLEIGQDEVWSAKNKDAVIKVQEDAFLHAIQSTISCAQILVEKALMNGPIAWKKIHQNHLKQR